MANENTETKSIDHVFGGRPRTLLVFVIYCLATALMTWPVLANLGSSIPGSEGDTLVHLWTFRWVKTAILNGVSPFYTRLLYFPEGVSLAFHNFAWLHILAWLPLQVLVGEVTAYSIVFLLIFPLNGLALYLLAREVTNSHLAAFAGGLVAAFWPYNLSHHNHPNLILVAWVPLTLLSLKRLLAHGRARDVLMTAFFMALIGISRWQLFIIAGPLVSLFLLYQLVTDSSVVRRRLVTSLLLVGLLTALLVTPLLFPVVSAQLARDDPESLFVSETAQETDLLAYILPNRYHPLWGTAVYRWYQNLGVNKTYTPFLGYTVLILVLIAIRRQWCQARLWFLSTLLYLLLALGSQLHVNGSPIVSLPSAWIDELFLYRLVRHSDRFNVMMGVPLAMLTALGVQSLLTRDDRSQSPQVGGDSSSSPRRRSARSLVFIVSILILAEFIVIYPIYPLNVPGWYRRLAREPGQFGVLDIPMGSRSYDKEYMLYQFTHGKPLVSGHVSRLPADANRFIESVPLLQSLPQKPAVPPALTSVSHQLQLLRAADVRYLVLHDKFLTAEQEIEWRKWLVLPPVYEDERLAVYDTEPAVAGKEFVLNPVSNAVGVRSLGLGLIDATISPETARAGDWISIELDWGSDSDVARNYDYCWQLANTSESVTTQCQPLTPDWPTSQWRENEIVRTQYAFQTDPFWPSDTYTLSIVVVEPGDAVDGTFGSPVASFTFRGLTRQFDSPTLTHATDFRWADAIRLAGYDITIDEDLDLTLHWQALRRVDQSYKVFTHLIDTADGSLVAQLDYIPRDWTYPTNWWEQGEFVTENIHLPLETLSSDEYALLIGLYNANTGERLPVYDADGNPLDDSVAPLHSITR